MIFSERLVLDKLDNSHADQYYADWLNDVEINQFLESRFSFHTPHTCRDYINSCNSNSNNLLLGIFHRQSKTHIGNIRLSDINHVHKYGTIGLFIGDKSYWGKGYATEAINLLTQYSFFKLGLQRIEAGCYQANFGSLRAFLKAGYNVEGFFTSKFIIGTQRTSSFLLAKTLVNYNEVDQKDY